MFVCRCDGPDVAHVPKQRSARDRSRIYSLFKACENGCLSCVRQLVEKEGVDPRQLSSSSKYTAMDFAVWGRSCSSCPGKYDDVIAYLRVCVTSPRSRDCSRVSPSAASPVHCNGPDVAHVPLTRSGKAAERIYYLYKAAEHGCLACVKQLVESEGLDPSETSSTCHYSAADFARWGKGRSSSPVRYEEVIAYLDDFDSLDMRSLPPRLRRRVQACSSCSNVTIPPPPLGPPPASARSYVPPPPPGLPPPAVTVCPVACPVRFPLSSSA